MAKRDYYEVLGLSKSANLDDVKKSYRKLAMQYHPDKNPGDKVAEEKFKEATEAYTILSDDEKRKRYDQFGFAGVEGMGARNPFQDGGFREYEEAFSGFEDIFSSFFGGGFGRGGGGRRQRKGSDLLYNIDIDLEDAAYGKKVDITYERQMPCESCNGKGSKSGGGKKICPDCGGSGQLRRSQGLFSISTPCQRCSGSGEIIENPCPSCRGKGIVSKKISKNIKIPPGIDSGKRIIIRGEGDFGENGTEPGDLHIKFRVRQHDYFYRDGDNLIIIVPISFTQAVLGDEINIITLDNKTIKLKIPSGCENGKVLRIKGAGVPSLENPEHKGDMYIKVEIDIPKSLNKEEKRILEEFRKIHGENQKPTPKKITPTHQDGFDSFF